MDYKLSLIPKISLNNHLPEEILKYNSTTSQYGLVLTKEDANFLVNISNVSLERNGRVEFGEGITGKIILKFADSPFIFQHNYLETLQNLIETFYYFKNETLEILSDDELIDFMELHFNHKCQGSLELLQNKYLSKLAHNVRYNLPFDYELNDDDKEEYHVELEKE